MAIAVAWIVNAGGGHGPSLLPSSSHGSGTSSPLGGVSSTSDPRPRLVSQHLGSLPQPLQDPAVAEIGGVVYAFGGLTAAQTSSSSVTAIGASGLRSLHGLPTPVHDAAAATIGGRLYVLGGGQSVSYSGIGRYDPAGGVTRLVGSLPTPLSDLAIATVGSTSYVVGGFTGQTFSNRIYAYHGGGSATPAGTLPTGLRYAAVATLGGRVIIAGGRTTSGPTAAVLEFDPASGAVRRIGSLPEPLMHAGAGVIGSTMYVVGGITGSGSTSARVLAIDATGGVRPALTLAHAVSDAGVATTPSGLVVVGGFDGSAPVADVWRLGFGAPPRTGPKPPTASVNFHGPLPGDLLIADRGNNRMLVVNPQKKVIWRFPKLGSGLTLHFDDDTFFTPDGKRIISNEEENHDIIQVTFPQGQLVWRYGHPGVKGASPGYLNTPDDAYALPGGVVIVADAYNCRVLEIKGHRILRSIGHAGTCVHNPPYSLGAINGDTPLRNGHILVSEINGSYIDEFTLTGHLVRVYRAPVSYPSDPQLTVNGNIILADYASPGGVVILNRHTGKAMWTYRPASGPGRLDHPSLAAMLPNGMVIVSDDYNHRIVIINPRTNRIVWQYGHLGAAGRGPGYLNTPDGFDFLPVNASGQPDPAKVWATRR